MHAGGDGARSGHCNPKGSKLMFGWLRKTPLTNEQLEEKIQAEIRSRVFKREKTIKKEKKRASDAAINIEAMQEMTDIVSDKEVEEIDREVRAQIKKTEKALPGDEDDVARARFEEQIQAEIRSRVFQREQDIKKGKQQASKAAINVEVMQEMTSLVPDQEVEKIDREVRAKHKKTAQKRARRETQRSKTLRLGAVWGSVALVLAGIYFHQWVAQTGRGAYNEAVYRLESPNPSEWLLGIDVNARDGDGMTPLMVEARRPEDLWRLKQTLKNGAEIDAAGPGGATALMWAVRKGNMPAQKALVSAGADPNARDAKGRTALMWAAELDQAEPAKLLIEKGADFGLQDKDGKTALMRAAVRGNQEITTLLMEKGAAVHVKDRAGKTALVLARENEHGPVAGIIEKETLRRKRKRIAKNARGEMNQRGLKLNYSAFMRQVINNNLKGVRLYLDAGMDVNKTGRYGITALHRAIENGLKDMAQLLITRGADQNRGYGSDRMTPIILAAKRGHSQIVFLLAKHGADLSLKDRWGNSALMALAKSGEGLVIEELLRRGANPNDGNNRGKTPLSRATKYKNTGAIRVLLQHGALLKGAGDKLMKMAVRKGDPTMVALMLKKGLDPNSRDRYGQTLLMSAANVGHSGILIMLIDHGAKIDAMDKEGNTALHWGIIRKRKNVVPILLAKGAKVNLRTKKGRSALMLAAYEGDVETIARLVKKGALINPRNKIGQTALMLAAASGNPKAVKLLLRRKARIGFRDIDGNNALVYAIFFRNANPKVLAQLLRKGARVNQRNKYRMTPLMFAASRRQSEFVAFLLKKGASINAKSKKGETALYKATKEELRENVRLLLKGGASVHSRTRDGVTALMVAKLRNYGKIANLLTARGARLTNNDTIWIVRTLQGNSKIRWRYRGGRPQTECDLYRNVLLKPDFCYDRN